MDMREGAAASLRGLGGDLRHAWRHYRRHPGATAMLLLVLTLGVGSVTGFIAFAQAMLTRPAAGIPPRDDLVRIRGTRTLGRGAVEKHPRSISLAEFEQLGGAGSPFASVAAWTTAGAAIPSPARGTMVGVTLQFVTPRYFEVLGLVPSLGAFPAGYDGGSPAFDAVLSATLWRDAFGASPQVIGQSLRINDAILRIVAVAPPAFVGATGLEGGPAVWIPLAARPQVLGNGAGNIASADSLLLDAVGRLAPGVTVASASAWAGSAVSGVLAQRVPGRGIEAPGLDVVPLRGDTELPAGRGQRGFLVKYGAVLSLVVLILLCVNVGSLQLGLAATRRRELALRAALGASHARLARQVFTESVLLSFVGAGLGLACYAWALRLLAAEGFTIALEPDLRTALLTAAVAVVTGVAAGMAPALRGARTDPAAILKESGGGSTVTSLQERFIIAQIALTQPVLLCIGLVIALVMPSRAAAPPDAMRHITRIRFETYYDSRPREERVAIVERTVAALRALPGVTAMSAERTGALRPVHLVHPATGREVDSRIGTAAPGYLTVMGASFADGHDVESGDTLGAGVPALISTELAREFFPGGTAVGREIGWRGPPTGTFRVVGVVDSRHLTDGDTPVHLQALDSIRRVASGYLIRTGPDADRMQQEIRNVLARSAEGFPVEVVTATRDAARKARRDRVFDAAFGGIGFFSLLLSALGLATLVAMAVVQRRREIGVRRALGSSRRRLVALFMVGALRLAWRGIALGFAFSLVVLLFLASGMIALATLAGIAVFMLLTALVVPLGAAAVPAVRAALADPARILRDE